MISREKPRRSLTESVLILFGVLIALESGYLILLIVFLDAGQKELAKAEDLCKEVSAIASFSADLQFCNNAVADRLHFRTLLRNYRKMFLRAPQGLKSLKAAFKDKPGEQADLLKLEANVNKTLSLIEKIFETANDGDAPEVQIVRRTYGRELYSVSSAINQQIDSLNQKYQIMERSTFSALISRSEKLLYLVLLVGFAINSIVAISIYWFFFRGMAARLSTIAVGMRNFGSGIALPPVVEGGDEIAQLDQAFRSFALKLAQSKTRESLILENSASFICSISRAGIILSAPAKGCANWGYSADELVGKRFVSLFTDRVEGSSYAALQEAFARPMHFENRLLAKDGTIFDLSWSAIRGSDGTIVCVAQDLSERKRLQEIVRANEERFRQIVNNLPLAVISCDSQGGIELVNNAVVEICQYENADLCGQKIFRLFPELNQMGDLGSLSSQPANHTLHCRGGCLVPVELAVVRYLDGISEKFIVCFSDISTRVEIEQAKRDFVSMIAHDLRSPLFALHGTLSMLATDESADTATFVSAEKTVASLIVLINDFLTLGKLEAGREVVDCEDVTFSDFWLSLQSYLLDGHDDTDGVSLLFETLPTDVAARLRIDRPQLFGAIAYIVALQNHINSEKHSIQLSCRVSSDQMQLYIYVLGCQLPAQVKASCAEGYSMISLGAGSEYSGLRLALSRTLLQSIGGSLDVATSTSGDAFVLSIPFN